MLGTHKKAAHYFSVPALSNFPSLSACSRSSPILRLYVPICTPASITLPHRSIIFSALAKVSSEISSKAFSVITSTASCLASSQSISFSYKMPAAKGILSFLSFLYTGIPLPPEEMTALPALPLFPAVQYFQTWDQRTRSLSHISHG